MTKINKEKQLSWFMYVAINLVVDKSFKKS